MSNFIRLTNKYISNLRVNIISNNGINSHGVYKVNRYSCNNWSSSSKNNSYINKNIDNISFGIRSYSSFKNDGRKQNHSYNVDGSVKMENPLENKQIGENLNVNFVKPNDIKPFKPRLPPYETSATLDFLIIANQKEFSEEEIEKFSKLAKALSSIGFQHQSEEKWKEALESYNKALLYIRNLFGGGLDHQHHFSLREYAALILNMGEANSRLENMDEAVLRSKQAIDLLEIDWREQVRASPKDETLKTMWLKDEMLGIAYFNHAEYLAFHSRHEEAEPFIRNANRILSKLYPLDHPVNVDCGVLMVEILNETGRTMELDKMTDQYGNVLTDALGVTDQLKSVYEKLDEGMMDKIIETVEQKFPGFIEQHEGNQEEMEAAERALEAGEEYNYDLPETSMYREKDFGIEDVLFAAADTSRANRRTSMDDTEVEPDEPGISQTVSKLSELAEVEKQRFGEDEFDQLQDDDLDIDDEELDNENDDEIHEIERMSGFKLSMDDKERYLQKKYSREFDQATNLLPDDVPINRLINKFDRILTEGSNKVAEIENERIIDRDRRIKNRPADVMDQVLWENGEIVTPTDEQGEPISQASMHKMGKYLSEELAEHEMDEDEEVMEESLGKLMNMVRNMSGEEQKELDENFRNIAPLLGMMTSKKANSTKVSELFNRSLTDLERDQELYNEMIRERQEENDYDEDEYEEEIEDAEYEVKQDPEVFRELMSKAQQYRFNPEELAKNIDPQQYLTKKQTLEGDVMDDDKEFDEMGLNHLLRELENLNFEGEDLDLENDNDNLDLDSFIKQATKSNDFKNFMMNESKKNK
ncbi:hypothetical protein PPL_04663 [Heterostelium album PN500]|uniref:Uncharacterized protein n=1 Tax=Heterostelium pallidum (strain ATCC 26659 / Pp 5 / PN500) TaxID=670386 RepID=D3B872_HETP5|nr:hypothetical protein PPL_04663 [Heterostelium album PN500]EFA82240.1 hypothetical protein PPL_04663 [Heterostelium album PN500]|eukprot:XP_020434357.1 hypothetical protein PPL_04663 [Heterostelium album PN500]